MTQFFHQSKPLDTDIVSVSPMIFIKKYPIPIFVLASLIIGGILRGFPNLSYMTYWLWIATLVIGGAPVVIETAKGILKKKFAIDIVAMIAIITAIVLNDAFPGLVIVLMQTGGRALEDFAFRRASSSLNELLARSPQIAHRITNNSIEDVNVKQIRVGDLLLVRPGDLVPVDGIITSNIAHLDESTLTGEPLPKSKISGDNVFSGTLNSGEAFEMRAEKISGESQYAKIVELVRKAQEEKAPIQRLADKYAIWFTPITLAVSAIGWVITNNLDTILSVLVVATPCSLIFATPVAIISGINKSAKSGIIVKSGSAIEQVGKVSTVVFDKTGTITHGTPDVEQILTLDDQTSEDDILYKAASIEQFSSHPAAHALVLKGKSKFEKLAIPEYSREFPGIGVEGIIHGEHTMVGSRRIFGDTGINGDMEKLASKIRSDGKMIAFVGINEKVSGAIVFGDKIRQGVNSMIKDLSSLGVRQTVMLTGDNQENAQVIARQAGLSYFKANLLPEEKVTLVKKMRDDYHNVVMVGDGINDAPALASSTVGIAMGSKGTAISAEAADIVITVDDVTKVVDTIRISQNTLRVARQSILVGLGSSVVLMVIASLGFIPPATGAILQEVLDVTVILNALRAR